MSSKCRLCGCFKIEMDLLDLGPSTVQLLSKCGINLEENKLLPSSNCIDCFQILSDFGKFIEKVISVQEVLNNELSKQLTKVYLPEISVPNLRKVKRNSSKVSSDGALKKPKQSSRNQRDKLTRITIKEEYFEESVEKPKRRNVKKKSVKEPKIRPKKSKRHEFSRTFQIHCMENIFEKELKGEFMEAPQTLEVFPDEIDENEMITELGQQRLSAFNWTLFKWPCDKCKQVFDSAEVLEQHSQSIHRSGPFIKCENCPKVCRNSMSFINHNFEHSRNLKFCCMYCNQYFFNPLQLHQHQTTEHGDKKTMICLYCAKIFTKGKGSFLHKHSLSHNTSNDIRLYYCDYCGLNFKVKNTLQVHMFTHLQQERSHICDVCGVGFFNKGNLIGHMYSHQETEEFECTVCQRKFKLKRLLKNHQKTHSNIKPHVCSVCGRSFLQNRTLKAHFRIHTGELPYECDFCGKKFRFDSCLTDHRRLHTGERPYVCSECPSAYANYSNYSKHMRGRHGIDPKKHKNESSQLIDNGIEKFEIFSTASTMHKY